MTTMIQLSRISIAPESDAAAFEEWMSKEMDRAGVGRPTRGGTVTDVRLLKRGSEYCYLVEWTETGGSPFGRERGPGDPDIPEEFEATTSSSRWAVVAERRSDR